MLGIGVLIDRVDRRRLLYLANVLRFLAFGGLAVALTQGTVSLIMLYAVYAAVGLIETTSDGAVFSVLPSAVPRSWLGRANSQIAGTQLVIDEFVGPPLGGFLFAAAAAAPIGTSSFACGIAALAFFLLRGTHRGADPAAVRVSVRDNVRAGLVWLCGDRIVAGLVLIGGLAGVAYSLPFSYLVLFVEQALGLDSRGYGLVMSLSALGGLLGSVLAPRLRRRFGNGTGIVAALLLGATSIVVCGLTAFPFVAVAGYICHAGVWNVLAGTVRQRVVPAGLLDRVGAIGRLFGYLGIALGAAVGGWLAAAVGIRVPFVLSGLCFLGCAVMAVRLRGPLGR